MKKNLLFNKIISLSLITALYLTMSISAYADAGGDADIGASPGTEAAAEATVESPEAAPAENSIPDSQPQEATPEGETPTGDSTEGTEAGTTTSDGTTVDGASTDGTTVDGASTDGTTVDGTSVDDTSIDGTTSDGAELDGTTSDDTQFGTDEVTNPDETADETSEEDSSVAIEAVEEIVDGAEAVLDDAEVVEAEEELDEEELEELEDEETGCEHEELIYTPNGDGTHTVKCANCEDFEEYTATCEYDENGVCIKCGQKQEEERCKHEELIYTSNEDGTHTVKCANCEDFEEYTESCEYDEDGICIHCGYKRLPDPILVYEDDEVIITVSGAVPENADLKVTPIKADNDATRDIYNDTADKMDEYLADSENEVYGFLAYDICFISIESGEEVEPSDDVTVSMEYKSAILPIDGEDVEAAEELKVDLMHIDEDTNEVENLTESGDASISKSSDTSVRAASFTNDDFSVYTLLWNGYTTRQIEVTLNNVFVQLVDGEEVPEYEEIVEGPINVNASTPEMMIIDKIDEIPGYKFKRAECKKDGIHKEVDGWKFRKDGNKYYLDLYNKSTKIESVPLSSTAKLTIDVYYEKNINLTVKKIATGDAREDTETEYGFVILNSEGDPYGAAKYYVGEDLRTVDAVTGAFTLHTGEKAEFLDLDVGNYYIRETEVLDGSEFDLHDFTTMIMECTPNQTDTKLAEFEAASDDARIIEVSVNDEGTKNIKFKNCHTTVTDRYEIVGASVSKYIRYHADEDNYDLTIKFLGPEEGITTTIDTSEDIELQENIKVDIVLVVDKSNSMDDPTDIAGMDRLDCVIEAVDIMIEKMKDKEDVDAKWKVIDFASHAKVVSNGWVDTKDVVVQYKLGEDESIGGGTNYVAGFRAAETALTGTRDGAKKIVIFLTDGCPTFYYGSNNSLEGRGNALTTATENATYTEAGNLYCDYFYAIGMGLKYNYYYNSTTSGINGIDLLRNVCDKVHVSENKEAFESSPERVKEIFDSLAGKISSIASGGIETTTETFYSTNVVMTDTLSEYVDILPGSEFKINVTKSLEDIQDENVAGSPGRIKDDGTQDYPATYTLPDGVVLTANYEVIKDDAGNVITRKISMVFPQGYVLDDGYEYQVKFYVEPSAAAYDYYYENNAYPHEGDDKTDHGKNIPQTSSKLPGFYSNGPSNTTYTIGGQSNTLAFPKPVVQVHFQNAWELYKINGDGIRLNGAEFSLQETEVEVANALCYTGTSSQVGGTDGLVVWNDTIQTGKTYNLLETKAPTGYVKSEENWVITISDENVPTVIVYTTDSPEGTAYSVTPERDGKLLIYRFDFLNTMVYTLPNTGGEGIYRTTIFGIAMMLTSTTLFYRNRRRQRVVNR